MKVKNYVSVGEASWEAIAFEPCYPADGGRSGEVGVGLTTGLHPMCM